MCLAAVRCIRIICACLALTGAIAPFLLGFPGGVSPAMADRQSWDNRLGLPGVTGVGSVGQLVVAGDGTIFAVGSAGNLVYRSTTQGSSFSNGVSPDGVGGAVVALAVSPNFALDGAVFAAIGRQVFVSVDSGVTWAAGPPPAGAGGDVIACLSVAPNFSTNGQIAVGLRTAGASNGIFHVDKNVAWGAWIGVGPAQAGGDATVAIGYSPTWASDVTVTAVTAAAGGTYARTAANWADFPAVGGGNQVHPGAATGAAIAFPSDYTPVSTDNMFLATSGTAVSNVFRKQGGVWAAASPQGATATPSLSIAVRGPYSSATILVAESGRPYVWKSTNGGVNWSGAPAILFGTGGPSYVALSPSFTSDGTVYSGTAGANGGFLVSTTGGGSSGAWAGIGLYRDAYGTINGLALVPNYPASQVAFIAETGAGGASAVFRTAAPWKKVAASTVASSIAISAGFVSDQTVYVVSGPARITKSTNGGQSFSDTLISDIPEGTIIGANALAAGDASTVFVATSQGKLHVSSDGGQTWSTRQLGLSAITQVVASPTFGTDRSVVVGGRTSNNGAAVLLSTDAGASFSALGAHPAAEGVTSCSVAFSSNYASDRTIYSGIAGSPVRDACRWTVGTSGAWLRLDAGASVTPGAAASPGQAISIASVASANGVLYAATPTAGDGVRRAVSPLAAYDGTASSWLALGWAPRGAPPSNVSADPARGRLVGGTLGGGTTFAGAGLLAAAGSGSMTYIVAVDTATNTLFSYEDYLIRAPSLLFPADSATLERHPGSLGGTPAQAQAYDAPPGAGYQFELSTDQAFNDAVNTVQSAVLNTPVCDLSNLGLTFSGGSAYYWRARVVEGATIRNATPWSAARSYMAATGGVDLLYPTSAPGRIQAVEALNPAFTWQAAVNATAYDLEVSETPNSDATTGSFTKTVVSQTVTTTSWQSTGSEFKGDTIYYWHVRPVFGVSKGKWSNTSAQLGASGVFRTPPAVVGPSTPVPPPATAPTAAQVLAPIVDKLEVMWGYDAANQAWLVYDPKAPAAVSDLKELKKGQGYFIKVSAAATLVYGGSRYQLVPGFNLIGWLG